MNLLSDKNSAQTLTASISSRGFCPTVVSIELLVELGLCRAANVFWFT